MATVRTARTRAVCSAFWPVSPSWSPPGLSRSSGVSLQIISLANLWKDSLHGPTLSMGDG